MEKHFGGRLDDEMVNMMNKTEVFNILRERLWRYPYVQNQLLRLASRKEINSFFSKFLPNHYQFPAKTMRTCRRFGLKWELDLSQLLEWVLYFDLRDQDFELLFRLVCDQQTVFDVGSNFGFPGVYLSQLVGPRGHIYCFEPYPESYAKLCKNIGMNCISNVTAVPFAVGSFCDNVNLENPSNNNSGQVRLCPDLSKGQIGTLVPQTTLDQFVNERNISKVDLIKVDVEGCEKEVFVGAQEVIRTWHPMIFFELSDSLLKRQSSSACDCLEYLARLGYRLFEMPTMKEIVCFDSQRECHKNVLAHWSMPVEPLDLKFS